MARNWSDSEIEAIIEDHFDMLANEQNGLAYNKSDHRGALREKIARSEGSIERKHMNISAVLNSLGLPYIDGYKPYGHYQKALFEAVEAYLQGNRDLHAYLTGENLTAGQEFPNPEGEPIPPLEYEHPPPLSPELEVPEDIRQIILRCQRPAERDARNRRLGQAGEAVVFAAERERLLRLGQEELSERVRWIARDDGDGFGFDVLSLAGAGDRPDEKRWLEVKTTTGPKSTPFFITRNELKVSKERTDIFRIVRLYGFRRLGGAYRLRPPLEDHVKLSAAVYRASF